MVPRVSVIIPAYNASAFIQNAIQSVLDQTFDSLEVLVIDDGSVDDTMEKVRQIADFAPNVRILSNTRSKGPSGARNTGLEQAAAEYIAFLDADDKWLPEHLKMSNDFLEKNAEIDVVFHNFQVVDIDSQEVIGNWFAQREAFKKLETSTAEDNYRVIDDDMLSALVGESFMHLQSMVIRNNSRRGLLFDESVSRSEDRDFCIRLAVERGAKFAFKDYITSVYHRHSRSLTTSTLQNDLNTLIDHVSLFRKYLRKYPLTARQRSIVRRALSDRYIALAYYHRKTESIKDALASVFRSVRLGFRKEQPVELLKIIGNRVLRRIKNE